VDSSISKHAEYAMALDLISRLSAVDSEGQAVGQFLELFTDLCAPERLAYVSIVEGEKGRAQCIPLVLQPAEVVDRLCAFAGTWAQTDDGRGFVLSVQHAGERLGVLEVVGIALPEQRKHYLNLALTLADVLGLTVSNARLRERFVKARVDAQAERDLARDLLGFSDTLNTINETIGSTLVFDDIMRRVAVVAAEATGADSVGLLRRGDEGWELLYGHGYDPDTAGVLYSDEQLPHAVRALARGELVLDNHAAVFFAGRADADLAQDTNSIMNVPLILKGDVFGVLSFRSRGEGIFTDSHADFARKLASSLSFALQNAQLFETHRTIADTLQQALLVMPKRVRGVEFGNVYEASTLEQADVGGDFYDLFEIDRNCVCALIGDVAGKGLEAAKLTSLVKDAIRAYIHLGSSPAWIIEKTNRLLFESTGDSDFVTVFLAVLDTRTGEVTYCSAGHPPALIRSVDGDIRALAVGSTIVGAFDRIEARDGTETLAPGETLVLYTDGITEARCKHEFFGEDRLIEIVGATRATAKDMPEALLETIRNCPEATFPDDIAILCISLAQRAGSPDSG
jgi:hypothetical protein